MAVRCGEIEGGESKEVDPERSYEFPGRFNNFGRNLRFSGGGGVLAAESVHGNTSVPAVDTLDSWWIWHLPTRSNKEKEDAVSVNADQVVFSDRRETPTATR